MRHIRSPSPFAQASGFALCLALMPLVPDRAEAALSGYYDSLARIGAILAAPAVGDALRQRPIEAITHLERVEGMGERWQVRSQDCTLTVTLRAKLPDGPGRTAWFVDKVGACE